MTIGRTNTKIIFVPLRSLLHQYSVHVYWMSLTDHLKNDSYGLWELLYRRTLESSVEMSAFLAMVLTQPENPYEEDTAARRLDTSAILVDMVDKATLLKVTAGLLPNDCSGSVGQQVAATFGFILEKVPFVAPLGALLSYVASSYKLAGDNSKDWERLQNSARSSLSSILTWFKSVGNMTEPENYDKELIGPELRIFVNVCLDSINAYHGFTTVHWFTRFIGSGGDQGIIRDYSGKFQSATERLSLAFLMLGHVHQRNLLKGMDKTSVTLDNVRQILESQEDLVKSLGDSSQSKDQQEMLDGLNQLKIKLNHLNPTPNGMYGVVEQQITRLQGVISAQPDPTPPWDIDVLHHFRVACNTLVQQLQAYPVIQETVDKQVAMWQDEAPSITTIDSLVREMSFSLKKEKIKDSLLTDASIESANKNRLATLQKRHRFIQNTQRWLLDKIGTWYESNTTVFLWLAPRGMGKSILTSRICGPSNPLQQAFSPSAYFFSFYETPGIENFLNATKGIVAQLVTKVPEFAQILASKSSRELTTTNAAQMFRELIINPFEVLNNTQDPPQNSYVIVMDGIDEMEDSSRKDFIDKVLLEEKSRLNNISKWLRIIVTMRPFDTGRTKTLKENYPNRYHCFSLETSECTDAMDNDIREYAKEAFRSYFPSHPVDSVLSDVVERSQHDFLYCSCMFEDLEEEKKKNNVETWTKDQIRDWLSKLPKSVNPFYEREFMEKLPARLQEEFHIDLRHGLRVYQIIVAAPDITVPLDVLALAILYNDGLHQPDPFFDKVMPFLETRLPSIVPVVDGHLTVSHRSVSEWLEDRSKNCSYKEQGVSLLQTLAIAVLEVIPKYEKDYFTWMANANGGCINRTTAAFLASFLVLNNNDMDIRLLDLAAHSAFCNMQNIWKKVLPIVSENTGLTLLPRTIASHSFYALADSKSDLFGKAKEVLQGQSKWRVCPKMTIRSTSENSTLRCCIIGDTMFICENHYETDVAFKTIVFTRSLNAGDKPRNQLAAFRHVNDNIPYILGNEHLLVVVFPDCFFVALKKNGTYQEFKEMKYEFVTLSPHSTTVVVLDRPVVALDWSTLHQRERNFRHRPIVQLLNLGTNESRILLNPVELSGRIPSAAFSPNGAKLAVVSRKVLWLFHVESDGRTRFELPKEFEANSYTFMCSRILTFANDGRSVIFAGGDVRRSFLSFNISDISDEIKCFDAPLSLAQGMYATFVGDATTVTLAFGTEDRNILVLADHQNFKEWVIPFEGSSRCYVVPTNNPKDHLSHFIHDPRSSNSIQLIQYQGTESV